MPPVTSNSRRRLAGAAVGVVVAVDLAAVFVAEDEQRVADRMVAGAAQGEHVAAGVELDPVPVVIAAPSRGRRGRSPRRRPLRCVSISVGMSRAMSGGSVLEIRSRSCPRSRVSGKRIAMYPTAAQSARNGWRPASGGAMIRHRARPSGDALAAARPDQPTDDVPEWAMLSPWRRCGAGRSSSTPWRSPRCRCSPWSSPGSALGALRSCWRCCGSRGQRMPSGRRVWAAFFGMGLLNNAIPFSLIVWGQQHIASGVASILNASTPLFTVIFAHLLTDDERMTGGRLAGVVVGFAGVAVMIGAGPCGRWARPRGAARLPRRRRCPMRWRASSGGDSGRWGWRR